MRLSFVTLGSLLVLLLIAQQLLGMPGGDRVARGLNNALHGCWFAAVAWLILAIVGRLRPAASPRHVMLLGGTIAVAVAMGTELVQLYSARTAGLSDVLLNLLGAGASLVLWAGRARLLRLSLAAGIAAALLLASFAPLGGAVLINLYRNAIAPQLIVTDSPLFGLLVKASGQVTLAQPPAEWEAMNGRRALRIQLIDETWPGFRVAETLPDWRPYRRLSLSAFVPGDAALPLNVSVRFRDEPEQHAYRSFEIGPGSATVHIDLDDLFDRAKHRVSDVVVYSDRRSAGHAFYLGRLWLEP